MDKEDVEIHKYSKLTYFFWWCSGSVIKILERQPTEKNKYVGIGAAIFGTWILATFSGIFAFQTIFHSMYVAVPLGIVYGLIIFNLDRFITSSMKKVGTETEEYLVSEKTWNFIYYELFPAIPRILIAFIIGLAISKPLELKLFEVEIQTQLEFDNNNSLKAYEKVLEENNDQEKKRLEGEIAELITSKRSVQKFINTKQNELNKELGGKNIGKRGEGVISTNIRSEIADAKEYRTDIESKIENIKERLIENDIEKEKLLEIFEKEQLATPGFFKKIEALSNLTENPDKRAIWWSDILIICLIVLIEMAPVIVKLISARGPYDAELDYENRRIMIELDRSIKDIKYGKKE